jgi:hypothetical protein
MVSLECHSEIINTSVFGVYIFYETAYSNYFGKTYIQTQYYPTNVL